MKAHQATALPVVGHQMVKTAEWIVAVYEVQNLPDQARAARNYPPRDR